VSEEGVRMKKFLSIAGIGVLAFVMSSCFSLQGFLIKAAALKPGDSTKILITVHPASDTKTGFSRAYQFVLIGVDTPEDLRAGPAVWGTNGTFGGPKKMVVQASLFSAIGTDCDVTGFTMSDLSGYTWKGYATQNQVNDRQQVGKSAVIQIGLKATKGAGSGDPVTVVGVTGLWEDATGDGVSGDDTFACLGNGSGAVNIK
jgi:hypothetical protein